MEDNQLQRKDKERTNNISKETWTDDYNKLWYEPRGSLRNEKGEEYWKNET